MNSQHSDSERKPRLCRYGQSCRRKDTSCKFFHPPPTSSASHEGQKTSNSGNGKPCRYGINCWSRKCTKIHPPGWDPQKKEKKDSSPVAEGTAKKKASPKQEKTPVNQLEKGFYRGLLRQADATGYKAAGILLLRRHPPAASTSPTYFQANATISTTKNKNKYTSGIQVLLCAEKRNKKKGGLELNLLGGKIEDSDLQDSRSTAAREFWEETGRIASLFDCKRLVSTVDPAQNQQETQQEQQQQPCSVWCGSGKYVLYVVSAEDEGSKIGEHQQWDTLPQKYHELVQSGNKPPGAEPDNLVWVDWDLIRDFKGRSKGMEISFSVPDNTISGALSSSSLSLEFSFFTISILGNSVVKKAVESVIESISSIPAENADSMQVFSTTATGSDLQELSSSLNAMNIEVSQ